jgi:hypothetical protein
VTPPAIWSVVAGSINTGGVPERPIRRGDRTWTRRLNRPDSITFSFDARDPSVPAIAERINDLWVYRQGADDLGQSLVSRLRVWTLARVLDSRVHRIAVTALDYSAVIEARKVWPSSTLYWPPTTEQADIAWELIADAQALTNGDHGITRGRGFTAGVGNTGIDREETVTPGDSIGKIIGQIGGREDGFDWDVDELLAFNVDHPVRGSTKNVGLAWGANVTSLTETTSAADYANAGLIAGSNQTALVTATAAGLAIDPAGRWEREWSFPSVVLQSSLDDRSQRLVDDATRPPARYSLRLRQGAWGGPGVLDVGDVVPLVVSDGTLLIDAPVRLLQIKVVSRTSGAEEVTIEAEETGT